MANRRFPIPLRSTGKLEYAAFWAGMFAFTVVVGLERLSLYRETLVRVPLNDTDDGYSVESRWSAVFWELAAEASCYGITCILAALECGSATAHAIFAAARQRNVRYLFETTGRQVEASRCVA